MPFFARKDGSLRAFFCLRFINRHKKASFNKLAREQQEQRLLLSSAERVLGVILYFDKGHSETMTYSLLIFGTQPLPIVLALL